MRKRSIIRIILIAVLAVGIGTVTRAATINVTTANDNVPGSLRAAITTANTNNEDDTIILPAGTYILTGESREDDNISGDLDIHTSYSITIMGEGHEITIIDGGEIDRVIHIFTGTISISGVTIQNGTAIGGLFPDSCDDIEGGAICSSGTLILTNCIIRNNTSGCGCMTAHTGCYGGDGGGIYNTGNLTLKNCTIKNNTARDGATMINSGKGGSGGGIFNTGILTISNSIISNNRTGRSDFNTGGDGGGIHNTGGEALITDCTISYNTTGNGGPLWFVGSGNGGGIYNADAKMTILNTTINNNITGSGGEGGNGGGIYNCSTLTLTNCTISNNTTYYNGNGNEKENSKDTIFTSAGYGGGIFNKNTLTLTNCTISKNITGNEGNGGGIYNQSGTATVRNTIIADNQVATGGEAPDYWGDLNSDGYNLIENTQKCNINGYIIGNITGVDPTLGPLADNGGPTQTHALLPGSPGIDAGNDFNICTDQRGYTRPVDIPEIPNAINGADIGAYEYESSPYLQISLSRTQLNFGADTNSNQSGFQTFLITNSGGGILNWSVSDNANWLDCYPTSGAGTAVVTVSVDPSELSTGTYTGTITVEDPNASNSPQTVGVTLSVYNANATGNPFGYFETPIDDSTVRSSIPVTGWALDDIEIMNVKIYRGEGTNLVYIGDAVLVEGARPDVEQAYPEYPNCYKAGWGYMMLTNFLPFGGNGSFTLHAIATDIEGNQVTLGTKTIVCDNANAVKPFGAIDTPAQGGTALGSDYVNFGWALTPLPNTIPIDGSTIQVWVDGVSLGNPIYNQYREDIASLFPNYNNSNGAVGYFYLDTTLYENGVHTIAWSAEDDAGNADGIGSRYFTIQNLAERTAQSAERSDNLAWVHDLSKIPINYSEPVGVIKGYQKDVEPQRIYPVDSGDITIEIQELGRIELRLDDNSAQVEAEVKVEEKGSKNSKFIIQNSKFYSGYQVIGSQLRPLPIGSTLDMERGIFHWQPGPGFIGDFEFIFIEKRGSGELNRKIIRVKISPRKSQ